MIKGFYELNIKELEHFMFTNYNRLAELTRKNKKTDSEKLELHDRIVLHNETGNRLDEIESRKQ